MFDSVSSDSLESPINAVEQIPPLPPSPLDYDVVFLCSESLQVMARAKDLIRPQRSLFKIVDGMKRANSPFYVQVLMKTSDSNGSNRSLNSSAE